MGESCMNEDKLQLVHQSGSLQALRLAGIMVLGIGGALTLIGLGSLSVAVWSFGSPLCSWCASTSVPLLVTGGGLAVFGYAGAFQP